MYHNHYLLRIPLLITIVLFLSIFTNCKGTIDVKFKDSSNTGHLNIKEEPLLIPIQYDYNNLNLKLNTSISDSVSQDFWRWDYMNSDGGGPDSTGTDYYMNFDQPTFTYNGEGTLPCLSIKTDKNRIIEFAATIIFTLKDQSDESLESLFDSLTTFDLLADNEIRQSLMDKKVYKNVNTDFEELIELEFSEEEYGYDRISYEIKNKTSLKDN